MGANKKSNCQCNSNDKCNVDCGNAGKVCQKHSDCCTKERFKDENHWSFKFKFWEKRQCGGSVKYNINYFKNIKKMKVGGFLNNQNENNNLDKWKSNEAKKYYNEVVKLYGEPDIKVNKENGLCIWYYENNNKLFPHSKIELKDEAVEHCVPANHIDFLYSYVKVYIPTEKIKAVISVSGSVNYDPLKKELFARCGSFAANYATLRTVFDKMNGKETDYPLNINNKDDEIDYNINYIIKELNSNNKKYKQQMNEPYHPLAFQKGCPNLVK